MEFQESDANSENEFWNYCLQQQDLLHRWRRNLQKRKARAPLTNVNEVYDPTTDTWETKESMPTPRSDLRANVVNGKIYLIGGHDPNVHFKPGASTHNEVYDPATDSWSKKNLFQMLQAIMVQQSLVTGYISLVGMRKYHG